jgi:3-oxoacyl-[acyl-carrier protein] reductase
MDTQLAGTVALVTGGSRNIGRAIAVGLAREGATVAISYQSDRAGAEETLDLLAAAGSTGRAYPCTLQDVGAPEALAAAAMGDLGPIGVLVSTVSVRPHQPLGQVDAAAFDEVFALNVRAAYLLSQAVADPMVAAGFGRMIFIGGLASYTGHDGRAAVMASKLALVGLARSLSFDLVAKGVTANVVVPSRIDTLREGEVRVPAPHPDPRAARLPVGRLGLPEEIADMCTFLASPRASFISGQELFVTGGKFPLTWDGAG